ncbi:MAG: SDR family oxidoreductase, partial [Chlamydiota bacterium]
QLSQEEIEQQIATNLSSVIYACKCVSLKPGSHIINIASSSYSRGKKNYALYSSAKAAVVNFTQALAEERPDLKINAAVPQRTATKMRRENFPDEDPASLLPPDAVAREILELLMHPTLTGAIVEIRKELTEKD